jgi:tRNA ligase
VAIIIKLYVQIHPTKSHEEVIWMFINTTQELTPSDVDNVVELEPEELIEDSTVDERFQEGWDIVRGYAPAVKKPDDPKDKKKLDVRYYGLLPEVDLEKLLDRALANETNKDFWTQLKTQHRVTKRPHVTIVHKVAIDTEGDLWNRCIALHEMSKAIPPLFKGTLTNVLWDGRVMAITVEDFDVEAEGSSSGSKGRGFVSNLSDDTRSRLHITVGTKNERIKPVEAKTMVQQWRRGEEGDNKIKSVKLVDQIVYGRIKGFKF